jgi:hypothetical protein
MEISGQLHSPDPLPTGKDPRYPLYEKLDAVKKRKSSCSCREPNPGRRYTDWATPTSLSDRNWRRKVRNRFLSLSHNLCDSLAKGGSLGCMNSEPIRCKLRVCLEWEDYRSNKTVNIVHSIVTYIAVGSEIFYAEFKWSPNSVLSESGKVGRSGNASVIIARW